MIKRFIIKTNEWYERLPKLKGDLFYLSIIFIPYLLILFFAPFKGYYPTILAMTWMFLVALWRTAFVWIRDWERIREYNDKNEEK